MGNRGPAPRLGPAVELRARFPGQLFDAVTNLAAKRGISLAELVRQTMTRELEGEEEPERMAVAT